MGLQMPNGRRADAVSNSGRAEVDLELQMLDGLREQVVAEFAAKFPLYSRLAEVV